MLHGAVWPHYLPVAWSDERTHTLTHVQMKTPLIYMPLHQCAYAQLCAWLWPIGVATPAAGIGARAVDKDRHTPARLCCKLALRSLARRDLCLT